VSFRNRKRCDYQHSKSAAWQVSLMPHSSVLQPDQLHGTAGQAAADDGAGQDIAEEVHAQQDERSGYAESTEEQAEREIGVEAAERDGYGESRDGISFSSARNARTRLKASEQGQL
jgi:hypothetical protein